MVDNGIVALIRKAFSSSFPLFALLLTCAYWKNVHPLIGVIFLIIFGFTGFLYYDHISELKSGHNVKVKPKRIIPAIGALAVAMLFFELSYQSAASIEERNEAIRDIEEGRYDWVVDTSDDEEMRLAAFKKQIEACKSLSGQEKTDCDYQVVVNGETNEDFRPYLYEAYTPLIISEDDIFEFIEKYEHDRDVEQGSYIEHPLPGMSGLVTNTKLGEPSEKVDRMAGSNDSPRVKTSFDLVWYFTDNEGKKCWFKAHMTNFTVTSVDHGVLTDEEYEQISSTYDFPMVDVDIRTFQEK